MFLAVGLACFHAILECVEIGLNTGRMDEKSLRMDINNSLT